MEYVEDEEALMALHYDEGNVEDFDLFVDYGEDEEEEDEEEEEEWEEDDDEEEDEEEEEEEEEDDDEDYELPTSGGITLRRVLYGGEVSDTNTASSPQGLENAAAENDGSAKGVDGSQNGNEKEKGGEGGEWDRGEIDGLICSICLEPWTSGGDHQVCCLPCGHLYGRSCITKWLQRRKSTNKCPQCNMKCTLKDIRILYASRIVAVDDELQQKVRSLEAKCSSLEDEGAKWRKKEVDWHRKETNLEKEVEYLKERTIFLEGLLEDMQNGQARLLSSSNLGCEEQSIAKSSSVGCTSSFVLQKNLQVDGARFLDFDSFSQVVLIARRLFGSGGMDILTKMSLFPPYEKENIQLPMGLKAIKDLCVSPQNKLVLLASLGKKLSVLSTESNNTVLTYDLPMAAWSCSWNPNDSHYIYAGLQNGMVSEFDIRQTLRPVESIAGLTGNPIHTLKSLSTNPSVASGVRTVLTASSVGLCQWNFGGGERPFLVPDSENQGVCISLAYGAQSDNIVASFRPKVESPSDLAVSQMLTPCSTLSGGVVQGSHIIYRRTGSRYQKLGSTCATVDHLRLPKSVVIERENQKPLFASGDDATQEFSLQELPSFMAVQHLKAGSYPIRDLKYARGMNTGLLGCLSGDIVQLFSTRPS